MFNDATGTPLEELPLVCVHPGASPEAWPFDITATAVELFEAMPSAFRFDELLSAGERLRHSPARGDALG